ncbi:DUF2919 family protein [Cedecea davisae]|uniref:DUF2919 family protein n=1 Tax=Cedecea davisae TaxID=158484 RepID=UPI00376EE519
MKHSYFSEHDYNANGELTLPWYHWVLMLIQGKAWVTTLVFAYIGIDIPQDISSVFWPYAICFYISLLAGLPCLICAFVYYFRSKASNIWRVCYFTILAGSIISIFMTTGMWLGGPGFDNELALILLIPDILCLVMYTFNQRLLDVFFPFKIVKGRSSNA